MSSKNGNWRYAGLGRVILSAGLMLAFGCASKRAAVVEMPEGAPPAPQVETVQEPEKVIEESEVYRLKSGDPVIVSLRGIPHETQLEIVVDENGNIRPPHLDDIQVAGLTGSEVARLVEKAYVEGQIYKRMTVNVITPSQAAQSYYIQGEVRSPGRYALSTSGVKLMQAIAAAGGYTEFANRSKIRILRGDKTLRFNTKRMEKRPGDDQYLQSGDVIVVPRSWL